MGDTSPHINMAQYLYDLDTERVNEAWEDRTRQANQLMDDSRTYEQFDDMEEVRDFDAQAIREYERSFN